MNTRVDCKRVANIWEHCAQTDNWNPLRCIGCTDSVSAVRDSTRKAPNRTAMLANSSNPMAQVNHHRHSLKCRRPGTQLYFEKCEHNRNASTSFYSGSECERNGNVIQAEFQSPFITFHAALLFKNEWSSSSHHKLFENTLHCHSSSTTPSTSLSIRRKPSTSYTVQQPTRTSYTAALEDIFDV